MQRLSGCVARTDHLKLCRELGCSIPHDPPTMTDDSLNFIKYSGTIARNAWERGLRPRLLRPWTRDRRDRFSGSHSTRQARFNGNFWTPESFNGRTTAAYKTWLQDIQPTNATQQYTSFLTKDVAESRECGTLERSSAFIKASSIP
jgi:hypothetical protein